jgi:hypothetical protein
MHDELKENKGEKGREREEGEPGSRMGGRRRLRKKSEWMHKLKLRQEARRRIQSKEKGKREGKREV